MDKDDWSSYWEEQFRGNSLPALLARLIDAYEANSKRARYVLRFRSLQGAYDLAEAQPTLESKEAVRTSRELTHQNVFEKTAHTSKVYLDQYSSILNDWYRANSNSLEEELTEDEAISSDSDFELTEDELNRRLDLSHDPYLERMMRQQAESVEQTPLLKEALAREFGLDPTLPALDLLIQHWQRINSEQRREHFRWLSEPKEEIQWAKELVGMLPKIASRSLDFERHPLFTISDKCVPESLRDLFEQAHMSYLFNQDVPCTLVCGSLLEHAFEIRFPDLFGEWDRAFKSARKQGKKPEALAFWQKLDIVVSKFSFCGPARQRADAVWSSRTEAMHHPDRYLAQARYRAIDALRDTREALLILFPLVTE
jgi:hypothetical protein